MGYRPDIDGLRAFAVLSVVAYHAFPETVKGGFIGVDVFFVISGYLIGGIILRDLERGSFSFWNFYSRRIRRIFPALIVVLAGALSFGWFALLPDEYKALGKHVLGGSTFVSNFVLWREAGYFDVEAKAKPLLHLWSLGIEEQFYIFFPLLLWFCFRKKLRISFLIPVLLFVSFCFNIYLHNSDRTADFYSPLTRVWELFAGVVCAMLATRTFTSKKFLIIKTIYYPPYATIMLLQRGKTKDMIIVLLYWESLFLSWRFFASMTVFPIPAGWRYYR